MVNINYYFMSHYIYCNFCENTDIDNVQFNPTLFRCYCGEINYHSSKHLLSEIDDEFDRYKDFNKTVNDSLMEIIDQLTYCPGYENTSNINTDTSNEDDFHNILDKLEYIKQLIQYKPGIGQEYLNAEKSYNDLNKQK